jgi:Terminase RNaseH-like domain
VGSQTEAIKCLLRDPVTFARHASGLKLRGYQQEAAKAIVDSVVHRRGLTFVVIMSRQAGKNELQAQLECYLMTRLMQTQAEIVKASPTFKPQTENAMRRLERVLQANVIARRLWKRETGYIYRVGCARIYFFSAHKDANVVGATASTLLECDEAQDVLPAKWDKDFAPMAASTNATTVFWGTIWTSRTLLARELRAARAAEAKDGIRRVFMFDAAAVGAEVEAYGLYVATQVQKLGRAHPLIKTQYFLEEIDSEGGMFPPARQALMQGQQPAQDGPVSGRIYALLVDVAGEDEDAEGSELREREPRKDSTALTIVEVDLSTLSDLVIRAPTYRVVHRRLWTGTKHAALYGQIKALAEAWGARYLVIDATGVGAGLASFLDKALPGRVIPFVFSSKSKSDLGYGFLAVIDSGRFKDYGPIGSGAEQDALRAQLRRELSACEYEILDGPGKLMRWAVAAEARDPETGEVLHDDLIMSAALCSVLDQQPWSLPGGFVVQKQDPMREIDKGGF